MKTWIVDLPQGSDEWKAHRMRCYNASNLACAMGIDPNGQKRSDLVRMYALGIEQEFSDYVQKYVIEPGHVIEEAARPIIESRIGDMLYPVTMAGETDGLKLSASLDGITIDNSKTMECKRRNAKLWDSALNGIIQDCYKPQMEQGLMLSGAEHCMFVVSDGTDDGTIEVIYISDQDLRAKIIPTWLQFAADVAAYQHVEIKAAVTGAPIESLPALIYDMDKTDLSITSNLDVYKSRAETLIERAKTPLVTDQDFADRDLLGKKFRESETMLKQKAKDVVGQVVDVAAFSQLLLYLAEVHRKFAVDCENAVKAEKENRRADIIKRGRDALTAHVATWNKMLGKPYMPALGIASDFPGAIKGKSNLLNIQDAADTELARCIIIADATGKNIQINLNTLRDMASDYKSLFTDTAQIIHKNNDDLVALIKARISDNKTEIEAVEARRISAQKLADQAERVRIEFVEAKAKQAAEEAAVKPEAPVVEAVKPAADFPCVHRAGTGAPMPIIAKAEITVPARAELLEDIDFNEFIELKINFEKLNLSPFEIARYFFKAGFLAGKAS